MKASVDPHKADIIPSASTAVSASEPPKRQRSHGVVDLTMGAAGQTSRVLDLRESGPLRLRFPKATAGPAEGILVNTAGGIACGDVFEVSITLQPRTDFVVTTTAAEKIYRSDGPTSRVCNRVAVGAGACLTWLPQETILFDHARLSRRLEADLASDASLLVVELAAFGRAARGERIGDGLFEDHWRIRRDGRIAYADSLRFEGPMSDRLLRPAIGNGARVLGTILDLSPGAEARLDEARAHLEAAGANGASSVEAGASAWNGHLAIRLLGPEIGSLRSLAARFLTAYRGTPMPRVWQSG